MKWHDEQWLKRSHQPGGVLTSVHPAFDSIPDRHPLERLPSRRFVESMVP